MYTNTGEPLWLRKQKEAMHLAETVSRLKRIYVYDAEEIIRIVGERYRRLKPRKPGKQGRLELEIKRLETVFNVSYTRLRKALEMPPLEDLGEFHRLLIDNYVGGENYNLARKRILRGLRLLKEFWNQYRWLIATSRDLKEAARLRREASGRMLSVVRRLSRDLYLLRRVREELVRTHIVAEGLPVVVVAGIPSSGKSTIVSKLSTAKPQIAAYPFTTKTLIVGKVADNGAAYYLVDTPGILERPPERLNEIERKALTALSALPDVVLFVFDPSPERVQDIESQSRLLKSIIENIAIKRDVSLLLVVNKADIASKDDIARAIRTALQLVSTLPEDKVCSEPLVVSALTGNGMEALRYKLSECVKRSAPWLFRKYIIS